MGERKGLLSATRVDRRQFLFGGALLAASVAGFALEPRRAVRRLADNALERSIPTVIGPWRYATASGLVVPPQDELSQRIYDQVLTRAYVTDGLPTVMLLIAYGSAQDAALALHRPEVCYPAAGYSITATEQVPVAGMLAGVAEATYLAAERGERCEQVYYWTRIGHDFPRSTLDEKLDIISANLKGQLPDGVLVRISVLSTDRAGALAQIQQFNVALLRSLGASGRLLLLGEGG